MKADNDMYSGDGFKFIQLAAIAALLLVTNALYMILGGDDERWHLAGALFSIIGWILLWYCTWSWKHFPWWFVRLYRIMCSGFVVYNGIRIWRIVT